MGNGVGGHSGTDRDGSTCGILFRHTAVLVCRVQSCSCAIDHGIAIWGSGGGGIVAFAFAAIMDGKGSGGYRMAAECGARIYSQSAIGGYRGREVERASGGDKLYNDNSISKDNCIYSSKNLE